MRRSGTALIWLFGLTASVPVGAAVQTAQFGVTAQVVGRASLEEVDVPAMVGASPQRRSPAATKKLKPSTALSPRGSTVTS